MPGWHLLECGQTQYRLSGPPRGQDLAGGRRGCGSDAVSGRDRYRGGTVNRSAIADAGHTREPPCQREPRTELLACKQVSQRANELACTQVWRAGSSLQRRWTILCRRCLSERLACAGDQGDT
jgi:hypothetical protein